MHTIAFIQNYIFLVLRRYPSERRGEKEGLYVIFSTQHLHDWSSHVVHKESVNATVIHLFLLFLLISQLSDMPIEEQ
jgi:hypothetical protein